jgi:hypothetical protein
VPGLPEVASLSRTAQEQTVAWVQSMQELGGLLGRCALALLVIRIVSRRKLLRLFQIPGLFLVPFVFCTLSLHSLNAIAPGIALAGFFTVAQFSFWGNYLPRMYPTHLRGTGESFAANVGGRMIGTSAAYVTASLVSSMPGASPSVKLAYAAALVGTAVYVIGFVASFFLPEPKQEELPE